MSIERSVPVRVLHPEFVPILGQYGPSAICIDWIGPTSGTGTVDGLMDVQHGDLWNPYDISRVVEAGAQLGIPAIVKIVQGLRRNSNPYMPFFKGPFTGMIANYPAPGDRLDLHLIPRSNSASRGVAQVWTSCRGEPVMNNQFTYGILNADKLITCGDGGGGCPPTEDLGLHSFHLSGCFGRAGRRRGQSITLCKVIGLHDVVGHFMPPRVKMWPLNQMMRQAWSALALLTNRIDRKVVGIPRGVYRGEVHENVGLGDIVEFETCLLEYQPRHSRVVGKVVVSCEGKEVFWMGRPSSIWCQLAPIRAPVAPWLRLWVSPINFGTGLRWSSDVLLDHLFFLVK